MKKINFCEWLAFLTFFAVIFGFQQIRTELFSLLRNEWVKPLAAAALFSFVSWKWAVCFFEKFRPFNDGVDKTPDLCLRNPGDGSGPYVLGFMPEVVYHYFRYEPISWFFRKSVRRMATVYPDGSVGFDFVPILLVAKWAVTGQLSSIPVGYTVDQSVFRRIVESNTDCYTDNGGHHSCAKSYSNLAFAKAFSEAVSEDILTERNACLDHTPCISADQMCDLTTAVNNLATSANSIGSRITSTGKKLVNTMRLVDKKKG